MNQTKETAPTKSHFSLDYHSSPATVLSSCSPSKPHSGRLCCQLFAPHGWHWSDLYMEW